MNDNEFIRTIFAQVSKDRIEKKTISIEDSNNNKFNITKLIESVNNIMKDQKDKCKDISLLGVGLGCGSDQGSGFMLGWIVQKIITSHNNNNKNKLEIITNNEEVSKSEIKEHCINILDEWKSQILKDDFDENDLNIKQIPSGPDNGINGTSIYD